MRLGQKAAPANRVKSGLAKAAMGSECIFYASQIWPEEQEEEKVAAVSRKLNFFHLRRYLTLELRA